MNKTTCALPDCDKPKYQSRPMCASHTMKQWRYGDPYYKAPPTYQNIVGIKFGYLTPFETTGSGVWRCRCDCGAIVTKRSGELNRTTNPSCGNARLHWRAKQPTYYDVHQWLQSDRGSARQHACVDCGKPARHWSYDNADPNELVDKTGLRYSANIYQYDPRCISCHKQFDMADRRRRGEPVHRRRTPGGKSSPADSQTH